MEIIPSKFRCESCNFCTDNKKDYSRHELTIKHKKMLSDDYEVNKNIKENIRSTTCKCGKTYKHISGLYRHRQNCVIYNQYETETNINNEDSKNLMLLSILKQNTDMIKLIVDELTK